MRINGLEQPQHNPDVHRQDMQIFCDRREDDRYANRPECQNHDFNGTRVLGGQSKWRRVLMMQLVNLFVECWCVQCTVKPIMPTILQHEEDGNLPGHLPDGWERHACAQTAELCHWVEQPDLRKFDGEVGEQDEASAGPLFGKGWHLVGLDLVLGEVRDVVEEDKGKGSAEVDNLVHDEGHYAGCKDVVGHVGVPSGPCTFEHVEVGVVE